MKEKKRQKRGTEGRVNRMGNALRDIFCPSKEQEKAFKQWIKDIEKQSLKDRKGLKLVREDNILYVSKPFKRFIGDCTFCNSFFDAGGATEGGFCVKHGIACGWGFTCKDNTNKYSIDVSRGADRYEIN